MTVIIIPIVTTAMMSKVVIIDNTMTTAVRYAILHSSRRHDCTSHLGEVCKVDLYVVEGKKFKVVES